MVVFQKDSVRKIISVVLAAAYTYCIFFKNTHVRCGFSCIQKGDAGSFKKGCNGMGISCNSAHSLKIIEGYTLTGEKYTDITGNFSHLLAFFYFVAILAE